MQIATIGTSLTAGTLAAAQDDIAPRAVVLPPEPPRDAPREAPPPPPPAVGGEGRWVFDLLGGQLGGPAGTFASSAIGGLGGIGFLGPFTISTFSNESDPQGLHTTYKSTVLALRPSVDYFVTERLSIGAQVGLGIIATSTTQQQAPPMPGTPAPPNFTYSDRGYTVGVAPRVGYVIPLSSTVALWPRIGAGYEISRQGMEGDDQRTVMRTFLVESSFGVGIRVAKHAFFDVGPVLQYRRVTSDAPTVTATASDVVTPGSTETFGASLRAALRVDL